jgi:hypothetical protein
MNENDREVLIKFFTEYLGVSCFWEFLQLNSKFLEVYMLTFFRDKPKNCQTLYLSNGCRILIDESFDLEKFFKLYGGKEILLNNKYYKIPKDSLEFNLLYATF